MNEVRNPVFHLPDIRHSFAEKSFRYCLIKQLNAENDSTITTGMVHTSSFPSYKYHIKNEVINNYSAFCNIDKCHVCRKQNSILPLDMAVMFDTYRCQ